MKLRADQRKSKKKPGLMVQGLGIKKGEDRELAPKLQNRKRK